MRSLTRYVLIELLIVFLMTLTGMTLLMLLVGLATEAYRQGLGAGPLLQIIPYLLPNALRFTVPGTIQRGKITSHHANRSLDGKRLL